MLTNTTVTNTNVLQSHSQLTGGPQIFYQMTTTLPGYPFKVPRVTTDGRSGMAVENGIKTFAASAIGKSFVGLRSTFELDQDQLHIFAEGRMIAGRDEENQAGSKAGYAFGWCFDPAKIKTFRLESRTIAGDLVERHLVSDRVRIRAIIAALQYYHWELEGWKKVVINCSEGNALQDLVAVIRMGHVSASGDGKTMICAQDLENMGSFAARDWTIECFGGRGDHLHHL